MKYWKVESTTQKGKYYIVREYIGKLRCNCPKFVFTGSCKHTASIGLGGKTTVLPTAGGTDVDEIAQLPAKLPVVGRTV